MIWFEFLFCACLLTGFAYNLCREGLIISEKTRMTEGIIGMFFLAVATSFPEVATGAAAVFSLGRIGLGYGDIVGSVIVNLMILAALDYFQGRGRILLKVSRANRVTAFFAPVVLTVILAAALLRLRGAPLASFLGVGAESVLIVGIYFAYLPIARKMGIGEHEEIYGAPEAPFWSIWARFAALLVIVMLLGMWMARIGEKIVIVTELSQTFTGTLLLGAATSFPEIIVSFAAYRAGSVDMAVGNILGSNLFDVCIVPFLDALSKGPILGLLTAGQVAATAIAFLLSGIAVWGLVSKRDTGGRIGWDTGLIFVIGLAGFVLLYFVR